MSKKSTTFLLASIVICKLLCLKILHISFFIASTCLGVFVQVASPSSLYNPTLTSRWVSWDNRNSKLCNCRQKSSCPLDGKCLTKCVVYKATVTETTSNNQETYIGLTENEFKTRFNLHKSSFKLEHKRTSTTLSDHVWKLKKNNINFNISWQVVKRVKPFAPNNKVCGLCLQEKLSILRSAPSLNKRSEIFGHCIHRKKFLLSNLSMSTDEVSIVDRNSES